MDSKAVSRRGVPVNDSKSFTMKRAVASAVVTEANIGAPPMMNRAPTPTRGRPPKRRVEDHIEMRPLLFGAATSEEGVAAKPTTSSASPAHHSAQQFADTWLGGYVKLKAKQAEKHVYNLRASLKSKKGFHVQIPKRMLFYSVLVFLVLPLTLFIIKETHIHDNDPAFHMHKFREGGNDTNRTHYRPEGGPQSNKHSNPIGHPNKRQKYHPSLQQLLAGGLPHDLEVNQLASQRAGYDAKANNKSAATAEGGDESVPLQADPGSEGQGMEDATKTEGEETPDAGPSPSNLSKSSLPADNSVTTTEVVDIQDNASTNGTRLPGSIAGNNTARRRRRRQRRQ
jgi:hypothetical protein